MEMKVMKMILRGFGGCECCFKKYLKNKNLEYPYIYMEDNFDFTKIRKIGKHEIDKKENRENDFMIGDKIYIYHTTDYWRGYSVFRLVDVDVNRPWTVEEYDGADVVKYLDEYRLVDEDINYHSV